MKKILCSESFTNISEVSLFITRNNIKKRDIQTIIKGGYYLLVFFWWKPNKKLENIQEYLK